VASTADASSVPVVDLTPWFSGDARARNELIEEIDRVCRRVGFLQVRGHGLSASLTTEMLDVSGQLFDLPEETKRRWTPVHAGVNRGYASFGSEALAYSLGVDTPPDMFEAFNVGTEPHDRSQPYYANDPHDFFAPNIWPDEPRLLAQEVRAVWGEYFAACTWLSGQLEQMFSLALDMPADFIGRRTSRAANVMRVINYERHADHPEFVESQMRMGAHTDYGVLTILLADPVPGLQILGADGGWIDVVPEPGALIVNLGDVMAEWTNDHWRSTLHRVVPPAMDVPGPARRRSVAFFHEADYDAVIEVMSSCTSPDDPPRYPPVVAGEHLMAKLLGPRRLDTATAVTTVQTSSQDRDLITRRS
jgi:isopenicillin N synthase-like dioxygenase